jgi:hypothetical protein
MTDTQWRDRLCARTDCMWSCGVCTVQAEEKRRNNWRERENWPRLIGQKLGGLIFSKLGGGLIAVVVLPQLRQWAWAAEQGRIVWQAVLGLLVFTARSLGSLDPFQ